MTSCRTTNKTFFILLHSKKTALKLTFKANGNITLIRDRLTWLWNWNFSNFVVMKLTLAEKLKKSAKKKQNSMGSRKKKKRLQFLSLLLWTTFCPQFHPILRCKPTISNFTLQVDFSVTLQGSHFSRHCIISDEWYKYKELPDELMEPSYSHPFFSCRMKMLGSSDGFILFNKFGVDFVPSCELLYPNM